jgi:polyhydroxyalkanoate synthase subunit PhaC
VGRSSSRSIGQRLRPPDPGQALANAWDKVVGDGVADLRRAPASVIHEAPQCTVLRYHWADWERLGEPAILLVPPLAGSSRCYDLRRGHSLVEYLLRRGHPVYLLEYGSIGFADRALGLEHWVDAVLPAALGAVAADLDGEPPHVVSWSLGGILVLLAAAAHPDMPVASVAAVASPFDASKLPLAVPVRTVGDITGVTTGIGWLNRAIGYVPDGVARRAFQLQAIDKQLTKPLTQLRHLDDRDYLASMEAVDRFVSEIEGYPGRTVSQLIHLFFRRNHLAEGWMELGGRRIELADVRAPVLAVAGDRDLLAPRRAVHHVGDLLPGAAHVRLVSAPGGHLGVLAGRRAPETTWAAIDAFVTMADRWA